jgi:hypothetical protein
MFVIDPAGLSLGAVITALVQAGIGVESVGFDPPWPAQVMG